MQLKRKSKKRDLILNVLKENPVHPTAEQTRALLAKKGSRIGLATVYRNLNLFAKEGKILKLGGLDGSEHFDFFTHAHSHFICERCGKIFDFGVPSGLTRAVKEIEKQNKMLVQSTDFLMKGLCGKCIKKH